MKRIKTKEYRMEVNVTDMIVTSVKLSAKEYDRKKRSLSRQAKESQFSVDTEFRAEEKEYTKDCETYFRHVYRVTLGTTDIELIEIVCKDGYCIKD